MLFYALVFVVITSGPQFDIEKCIEACSYFLIHRGQHMLTEYSAFGNRLLVLNHFH